MTTLEHSQYDEQVDPWGTILSVDAFMSGCKRGSFVDNLGCGYPALETDGEHLMDATVKVYPSKRHHTIPECATHIVWVPNE